MANRIKFPELSTRDLCRVVEERRLVPIDDSSVRNQGLFVVVWDTVNPEDGLPMMYPLDSVTLKREAELAYTVRSDRGYEMTYKHAALVDDKFLPFVLVKNSANSYPFVGKFVGCFIDKDGNWCCSVRNVNSVSVYFVKPSDITFIEDVNFGIVEEEDNG